MERPSKPTQDEANVKKISKSLEGVAIDFVDASIGPKPGIISKLKCAVVDVIVTNVVGPNNFCVQEYRQSANLKALEEEMTVFYENYSTRHPSIQHENICSCGYYAAKSSNLGGRWARVQVVTYKPKDAQITVYLLDHGSYDVVHSDHLRQLRKIYVERLPVQAYPAKLHFLPIERNSMDLEETKRFKKDVEGKTFCAFVADEIEDEILQVKAPWLSLILIDTSGPKDRYIHQSYCRKK